MLSGRLWSCRGDCGAVGVTVVLLGGTCRGDCGAVGVTVVLLGGMLSGRLWYCWEEPVGEAVESEDAVGVTVVLLGGMLSGRLWCCRGDCGAVGGNLSG